MTEKKLTALDLQITNVLNSDLPDDEKAKLYGTALLTYRTITDKLALINKSSAAADDDGVADDVAATTADDLGDEEILDEIPTRSRKRAKRLLGYIKQHVRWNDDGEIAVGPAGLIPKSDIVNLLTESVSDKPSTTRRKLETLPGWAEYVDSLKMARVPDEYITSRHLRKDLKLRGTQTKKPPAKKRAATAATSTESEADLNDTVWDSANELG
jgi:hypothetical protein